MFCKKALLVGAMAVVALLALGQRVDEGLDVARGVDAAFVVVVAAPGEGEDRGQQMAERQQGQGRGHVDRGGEVVVGNFRVGLAHGPGDAPRGGRQSANGP